MKNSNNSNTKNTTPEKGRESTNGSFVWDKRAIAAAKKVGEIIRRNEADEFKRLSANTR